MKKEGLGALIILAGVAVIGFIWFKKNKPTTSNKQLAELTAQSNALAAGSVDNIDKPFEYDQTTINTNGVMNINPIGSTGSMYSNMKPQEVKALSEAVYQACPMCANIPNIGGIGAINMQNLDFSKYDFSNIQIK